MDLEGARLQRVRLQEARLQGADLKRAHLSDLDLSRANLQGANLSKVIFSGTVLNDVQVDQATLENTNPLFPELLQAFVDRFSPPDGLFRIIREIEFPPEYRQAGIGILHYFSEILRHEYPDVIVPVRIEQEVLIVRMIIETPEGQQDTIERTLADYGLVVTGKMPPEQFLSDPYAVIAVKSELRVAHGRIETQKELIETAQYYAMVNNSKIRSHFNKIASPSSNPKSAN
uniref:Pentapeptide repeat-containing protein n=1 Tax=Candidatus Entotheonella serta TaxID=1652106 RepID=A0A0K0PDK2_9BACT|nr:hypothetical protein [Candidatus Entotheonella serta]